MAGANPEVRGHPGASGKPDIPPGKPGMQGAVSERRADVPPVRRTAAVGGRCTAPGTVRHVAVSAAAGRTNGRQAASAGPSGSSRAAPATAGRRADCRGATPRGGREAEQTLPGPAGNPGDREGPRAERARGRCRERQAAAAALDGSRIGIEGRTAAPTTCERRWTAHQNSATPRPSRPRCGRGAADPSIAVFLHARRRHQGRRRACAAVVQLLRQPQGPGTPAASPGPPVQLLPHVERERVRRCGRRRRFRRRTLPSPPSARAACRTGRCAGRLLRRGRR